MTNTDEVSNALACRNYQKECSPWARFFARVFDLYLLAIACRLAMWHSPDILIAADSNVFRGFSFAIMGIAGIPIEAICLALFGTTPGKFLHSIRIRTNQNIKLSFAAALKRTILVYIFGIAFWIPPFSLVTLYMAYSPTTENQLTYWDKKSDAQVWSREISRLQLCLAIMAFAATFYILGMTEPHFRKYSRESGEMKSVEMIKEQTVPLY